jgi:hypothetical protein
MIEEDSALRTRAETATATEFIAYEKRKGGGSG